MLAKDVVDTTGISKDTLRYYEREGVISEPQRNNSGYRIYTERHIQQIKFIRYAQSVGFTLSKIKTAIPHIENSTPNCPILQNAIREHLDAIDAKIAELKQAKQTLAKWIMPQ